MKKLLLIAGLLMSAAPTMAQDHTDVVARVKADLVARGVNISGPCGAFQITGRVAWLLKDEGWGLLSKNPAQNGCSTNGDRYAVDFLVHKPSGQGVDMLVNSETQNIPLALDPRPCGLLEVARTIRSIRSCHRRRREGPRAISMATDGPTGGLSPSAARPPSAGHCLQRHSRTDIPAPADYDGTQGDPAAFRRPTSTWYIVSSRTASASTYTWGGVGDIPVPADYDGDGKADIAVFRRSTGAWYIVNSRSMSGATYTWGGGDDIPVPGDYDGDGKTDIAVFRPSNGTWYIINSSSSTGSAYVWGGLGDVPVPVDYDGDGRTDIAVFRAAAGTWYIVNSRSATGSVYLGAPAIFPCRPIMTATARLTSRCSAHGGPGSS